MGEFNLEEWERERDRGMRNVYAHNRPAETNQQRAGTNRYPRLTLGDMPKLVYASEPERRWTFGGIVWAVVLLILCGLVVWSAFNDLADRLKPAQPVTVQEEKAPDVLGQIRALEGMIAQAHQLKQESDQIHADLQKMLEKMEVTGRVQRP